MSLSSCFQFRMSDRKQLKSLQKAGVEAEVGEKKGVNRNIHYTLAGKSSEKPLAVFIHGSPGSSSNYLQYAQDSILLEEFQVLLIDRPGFGHSGFGNSEPQMDIQAEELNAVLEQFQNNGSIYLIGHSLGGPIICRMAMEMPGAYEGLLIIAGSVSPELEPEEKWRKTLNKKGLRWVLPRSFRVSNQEILPAKQELHEMDSLWPRITSKVSILQGEMDKLVPPGNAHYAEQMLINADVEKIMLPEEDHFIPFTQPELLRSTLLDLYRR
ncbi:alpha/beta hydrolase [bacterium]|nr:alpha/beta hydrolase [bacterium]